ncbi:unnamed protein product [Pleuronectes platessa]|uniref:R-spondin Fu-CRD domain-containing protein n=1 Tax=Pleuronectes platessa TaxID=8262 RepID=A0A9N7U2Q7_PLEPL|nr:unnamed protein product [Pleuronectes platessa]
MSHHGTCVLACPAGHYGQRGKDVNRCTKCRSLDCEHCFSRDFCTRCRSGFLLHKGKCLTSCPQETFAHQTDCVGSRLQGTESLVTSGSSARHRKSSPTGIETLSGTHGSSYVVSELHLHRPWPRWFLGLLCSPVTLTGSTSDRCCQPPATLTSYNCLLAPLGDWSEWSVCLRDGAPCGFRWGGQTRTRGGRTPEDDAARLCPSHSETQRCRMKKKCPTGEEGGDGRRGQE